MSRLTQTAVALTLLIALTATGQPASAVIERYIANLNGFQTIPQPNPTSSATGTAVVDLNPDTESFDIRIEIFGVEGEYDPFFLLPNGNKSGTHIHLGTPVQASTMHIYDTFPELWVNEQGNNNPSPGDWAYEAFGQVFINEDVFSFNGFLTLGSYVNVHTRALEAPQGPNNRFNAGEIRGQMRFDQIVPEPLTGQILLLGAAYFVLRRRPKYTANDRQR